MIAVTCVNPNKHITFTKLVESSRILYSPIWLSLKWDVALGSALTRPRSIVLEIYVRIKVERKLSPSCAGRFILGLGSTFHRAWPQSPEPMFTPRGCFTIRRVKRFSSFCYFKMPGQLVRSHIYFTWRVAYGTFTFTCYVKHITIICGKHVSTYLHSRKKLFRNLGCPWRPPSESHLLYESNDLSPSATCVLILFSFLGGRGETAIRLALFLGVIFESFTLFLILWWKLEYERGESWR